MEEQEKVLTEEEPAALPEESEEDLFLQVREELGSVREKLAELYSDDLVPTAEELAGDSEFIGLLGKEVSPEMSFLAVYGNEALRRAAESRLTEGAAQSAPGGPEIENLAFLDDEEIEHIAKLVQRGKRIAL